MKFMIESCNGTIDGSISPFSLSLFFSFYLPIPRKNFYFKFHDEIETIFHRDTYEEKETRNEKKKRRNRGEENAPIETARSFPCFQLSIGEEEEEEEDECSSERG